MPYFFTKRILLFLLVTLLCLTSRNGWATSTQLPTENPIIQIEPRVEERLRTMLTQAGYSYPLRATLSFLVFKEERTLEVWLQEESKGLRRLKSYPVLGMSGFAGPKQRQGDRQVPEGLYQIIWLNPNSDYHLSMKLDYPNAFDRRKAQEEGRSQLGGDIFVHGGTSSVGCIAMGNEAIEELFVMTLMLGTGPAEIVVAPYDFRRQAAPSHPSLLPHWLPELYQQIANRLAAYPSIENE
ncbi:MAG: L,D-transpeptidase family protein [Magnetococcales bacterium]|nr:L,D-transpeptidase family protein [Magnetococcales bacterium]MBF0114997.1 L,D-transpeptidase family protein [Magnetococcales bacterium]